MTHHVLDDGRSYEFPFGAARRASVPKHPDTDRAHPVIRHASLRYEHRKRYDMTTAVTLHLNNGRACTLDTSDLIEDDRRLLAAQLSETPLVHAVSYEDRIFYARSDLKD